MREVSVMRCFRVLMVGAMLLGVLALGASAQDKPLTFHVGAGYAKLLEDDAPGGSIGLTGGVIYNLEKPEGFAIGGEAGYLMLGKEEEEYNDDEFDVSVKSEAKLSVIPITAQGYYMVPMDGSLAPFLTLGLGFYNVRASVKVEVDSGNPVIDDMLSIDDSDSETKLGMNFGGGLKFGAADARVRFGADARYHIVMTDVENTDVLTLMGRVYF
ncbi:MAG: porin family protein [Candidatus Eisenbacteria bacterium]|nr:porin family protein [Candidatus Eisenbacteria bacterium]